KNLTSKKIIDFNHKSEVIDILHSIYPLFDSYRKPESRMMALTQRIAFIWLDRIEKNNFDVFSAKMQVPPAFFGLRLLLATR
ncbi:MAG: hypothetical protein DI551_09240, partial [Micavibrio aeruginosavorus]